MKTLITIAVTAWVTVIAHNQILDNDTHYYRFKRESLDTVCAIHKFYKDFESN